MNDEIRAQISENIRRFGQHLVNVYADANSSTGFEPFTYTIGNHGLGLPELLFVGSADDWCCSMLNILGEAQRKRRQAYLHGEMVGYTAEFPALIVDAGQKGRDEYAVQVGVYYNTNEFDVCQVLLSDRNGRYPGDPKCLPPYSEQIVLSATH